MSIVPPPEFVSRFNAGSGQRFRTALDPLVMLAWHTANPQAARRSAMAEITITLHPFDNPETAAKVADAIRQRGEVSYVDDSGDTVKVTVGDVTVSVEQT